MEQGRKHEALELLQSVLHRVTEGQSTPDVTEAVALRQTLIIRRHPLSATAL
jgi:hypothetical protein